MEIITFDNLNIDSFQPIHESIPDGWFDDVRQFYGESLPDEMISQSVEETCDFFHIDKPAIVADGWTTGVYPNNDFTLQDDVLFINREQLLGMGISGKDGFDLVMTHEGTHRALQGLDTGFDSHQEELCCDYMAGVRAGLNGIDVSQMENSLIFTPESETHPAGVDRVESIEAGIHFAQQYYAEHNMAPTFNECLDNFCDLNETESREQITLRVDIPEDGISSIDALSIYDNSDGNISDEQTTFNSENDQTLHAYTQSEIKSRISKAETDMRRAESNMRHNETLIKSKVRMGEPHSFEDSQYNKAQSEYNRAQSEYYKWKGTKAD